MIFYQLSYIPLGWLGVAIARVMYLNPGRVNIFVFNKTQENEALNPSYGTNGLYMYSQSHLLGNMSFFVFHSIHVYKILVIAGKWCLIKIEALSQILEELGNTAL